MDIKTQAWESLDKAEFFKKYWQKKALFVKGAFRADFSNFLGDHLAGLSLESEARSRLVFERPKWSIQEGPFDEGAFASLPKSHWTLLVQEVEQWVDEIHEFRKNFAFIPRWRADDVMVSYSSDQGGVGAHVDHYDVFLIQASGKKKWRIETGPSKDDSFIADLPIRILKNFEPSDEILAEPGDVLYLPPEWAHEGVAQGESMTWSVGFRSPSANDVHRKLSKLAPDLVLKTLDQPENVRFSDPDLKLRQDAFSILSDDLKPLQNLISVDLNDTKVLAQALGELVSESYRDEDSNWSFISDPNLKEKLEKALQSKKTWTPAPSLRCFYFTHPDQINLFANGKTFSFAPQKQPWVTKFCNSSNYHSKDLLSILDTESGIKLLTFFFDESLLS